ncbi:uncharacterized protein [Drosophila takahashii]|uniref:uncharacterized protein n=1 Tax=Drosophila takahashii TaxID=29030 RepID=UPI00389927B5
MSYSQDAGRSYSPFDAISPHNPILERIMHELEMSKRREELILKELEESKRREEGNTKLLKTLTEEIIMLRGEVRQLKAFPVAEPVTSRLNMLPFDSLESFQEFDLKIYTDDELRRELKSKIKMVGGQDVPSFTRLAIKAVISDKLAVDITWRGTPEKPSVQMFVTYSIIKEMAILKFPNATEVDVNKVVQQHFLHARDRVYKRQKPL